MDIIYVVIGIISLIWFLTFAITYWYVALLILGVVLIKFFTIWASIAVFLAGYLAQIWSAKKTNKKIVHTDALGLSFGITIAVIIISFALAGFWETASNIDGDCSIAGARYCN